MKVTLISRGRRRRVIDLVMCVQSVCAVILALLAFSSPGLAQETEEGVDMDPELGDEADVAQPYLRLGYTAGFSNSSLVRDLENRPGVSSSNLAPGQGVSGAVGFRFLARRLGAEAEVLYIAPARLETNGSAGPQTGDVDSLFMTANLRYYPLLGRRIEPFALVGLGAGHVKLDVGRNVPGIGGQAFKDSGFVTRFGAGFETPLTKVVDLYVDAGYLLTTGAISGNDYGTVGVGFLYPF